jgi:hypothetical protein
VAQWLPLIRRHALVEMCLFSNPPMGLEMQYLAGGTRRQSLRWICQLVSAFSYSVQLGTTKNKLCFLHTNTIGRSSDNYVRRHVRGIRRPQVIRAPLSQKHYREYFNAVDINDRDNADYSTSICTIRYYIRLLCWSLDRVIHTLYVIVCECARAGIGKPKWKKYI